MLSLAAKRQPCHTQCWLVCLLAQAKTAGSILINCRKALWSKFLDVKLPASILLLRAWWWSTLCGLLPPSASMASPSLRGSPVLNCPGTLSSSWFSRQEFPLLCAHLPLTQVLRLQYASVFLEGLWECRLHGALAFCTSQGHCWPLLCLFWFCPTSPPRNHCAAS